MATPYKVGPTIGLVTETFMVGTKAAPLVDADKGKAVKLADGSRAELGAATDEILGFLTSVEPGTKAGFKIGGLQMDGFALVDTGDAAVGDLVVVDTNPASGTAGLTKVKTATGTPKLRWMVMHPGVIRKV